MSELEIPERARWAFGAEAHKGNGLEAAAPIIVAAELRRLVSGLCTNDALYLLKRAAELDPEGSAQ